MRQVSRFFAWGLLGWMVSGALAQEAPAPAKADKAEKAPLPKCPVAGEDVNFAVFAETPDGPVFFCCGDCKAKFSADAKPYADKVKEQREALKKAPRVQVTCPGSGEPIDPMVFSEKDGEKVYFCCNDCKGSYEAAPDKYAGKLAASYTYQTRCPVMGTKIKPNMYVTMPNGEKVYFCCGMCDRKFVSDPAKYSAKLESQGYKYDEADMKNAKPRKAAKPAEENP